MLSIDSDLKQLITWLRERTTIAVHDEEGKTLAW